MIKFELRIFGDSPAELYSVVDRLRGQQQDIEVVHVAPARDDVPPVETAEQPKRTRKPRSDAGQARGPYKNTATPDGNGAAAPVAEAPVTAGAANVAPSAAVPTVATVQETTIAADGQHVPPAAPVAAPTEAEARAALKRINETKGLGMEACMGQLRSFNIEKISALPKEDYAQFIASCDKMVAAHLALQAKK